MSLLTSLKSRLRDRRHRRQARVAIAQAQRDVERRLRRANPGYDELKDPLFIGVMVVAVLVVAMDDAKNFDTTAVMAWLRDAVDAIRSWA